NPVLVDEGGMVIAGHARLLAARQIGITDVPVMVAEGWSEAQKRAYVLADNQLSLSAGWDDALLRGELQALKDWGFDTALAGFPADWGEDQASNDGAGSLAEKFGVPPFSVLNAREGWWQDRKAAWLAIGIQSELG